MSTKIENPGVEIELPVVIERQPDYTTCGPTSLHAVYSYFGDDIPLDQVIRETPKLPGGGTLNVHLAVHALRRGYQADMWTSNVTHWDPTWFTQKTDYVAKLRARLAAKGLQGDARYAPALEAVEEFFRLGGKVYWGDLTPRFIGGVLKKGVPILTGTNGTYLYQCARETAEGPDDVAGDPFGHFIVVCGYNSRKAEVSVADPLLDNPAHGTKYYKASVYRLIGAIFLGASSDDSNLLAVRPRNWRGPGSRTKYRPSA